jgi:hypothetical protein
MRPLFIRCDAKHDTKDQLHTDYYLTDAFWLVKSTIQNNPWSKELILTQCECMAAHTTHRRENLKSHHSLCCVYAKTTTATNKTGGTSRLRCFHVTKGNRALAIMHVFYGMLKQVAQPHITDVTKERHGPHLEATLLSSCPHFFQYRLMPLL